MRELLQALVQVPGLYVPHVCCHGGSSCARCVLHLPTGLPVVARLGSFPLPFVQLYDVEYQSLFYLCAPLPFAQLYDVEYESSLFY